MIEIAGDNFQAEVEGVIFAELAEAKESVLNGTWTTGKKKDEEPAGRKRVRPPPIFSLIGRVAVLISCFFFNSKTFVLR